jgi:hypothetical protein
MPQTPTLTGQDIAEAQGAVRALLDRVLAGTDTTSNEYVALRVLSQRGPAAEPAALHRFLAEQPQLRLDRAGVADLFTGLETRGLVSGTAPDGPGPARLTAAGAARHAELADAVTAVTVRLYTGFDPDDLVTTHRVLTDVTERANRLRSEL